jgi:F-type H+-transporting ATPase subunit b
MLIDWFTVIAQVVNFLILVWLMKRFLYKPVLHAIDEREKRIAAELKDAAAKEAEARDERDEFRRRNEDLEQHRADLLSQAAAEAKAQRERLFDAAQRAADAYIAKRRETVLNDAHDLNQAVCRRIQEEVIAIARKVLADLAGASLEERMIDVFVRRLRELDAGEKGRLAKALGAEGGAVTVRTTFGLTPEQCASAEGAIKDALGKEAPVRFEAKPELISGIEVVADGQKVGWSIADYLGSLEIGIADLLKQKDNLEAKVIPEAGGLHAMVKGH